MKIDEHIRKISAICKYVRINYIPDTRYFVVATYKKDTDTIAQTVIGNPSLKKALKKSLKSLRKLFERGLL